MSKIGLWQDRIEIERLVLGWLFAHPEAWGDDCINKLSTKTFHYETYREVFDAMVHVLPIADPDLLNVKRFMAASNRLEKIGGPATIAGLVDELPYDFPFADAVRMLTRGRGGY